MCIVTFVACGGREDPPIVPMTEENCASLFPVRQGGICLALSDDPAPMIQMLDLKQTQLRRDNGRFLLFIQGVDCNAVNAIAKQAAPYRPIGNPFCFPPQ